MNDAGEDEVRKEFETWFRAATFRDLDGLMTKIADDAVSYEHEAPLQHHGAPAIREVCRKGFAMARGQFKWNVPDLRIVVRGDIAVTWGLNRMQFQAPGEESVVTWSRGTRVFQKIAGKWKLIHQHVSFPYDPETGQASASLSPETSAVANRG